MGTCSSNTPQSRIEGENEREEARGRLRGRAGEKGRSTSIDREEERYGEKRGGREVKEQRKVRGCEGAEREEEKFTEPRKGPPRVGGF